MAIYPAFRSGTADPASTEILHLLQIQPNPFVDETTIGFILPPGGCAVQLRTYDVTGRELWRIDKYYPGGYNAGWVQSGAVAISGGLYYKLKTPFGMQTKSMARVAR